MILLYSLLGLSLCALFIEAYLVRRALRSIPIRIHVNGTRGKSTVTRYIAAGLRAGGFSVAEKITGVIPTYISPAGRITTLHRRGSPRVQEQVSIVRRAAADRAQALVIECMSLQPEYQRLESRIISPTVSIITNVRNDHREVMGETAAERIAALSESIPTGGTVVTSAQRELQDLHRLVARKQASIKVAESIDESFPAGIHKENVDIALAVCSMLGIERKTVMQGIATVIAEKEEEVIRGILADKEFVFFNGFTINDIESTEERLKSLQDAYPGHHTILILNTRKDRPVRTSDFAEWAGMKRNILRVIISGTHADAAVRLLRQTSNQSGVTQWKRNAFDDFPNALASLLPRRALIVGVGNIAGDGFRWIESFKTAH